MAGLPDLKLVLLIGQYAQAWHLGRERGRNLTETVRQWRRYAESGEGVIRLPLPHPSWRNNAWLKKNPWFGTELLPYLRANVQRLLD